MSNNAVVWFDIYVADMPRAKAFYEGVFGIALEKLFVPDTESETSMEMWAFKMQPEGHGCAGALVKMAGVSPGGGGTLVYFSCEDCAVEEKKAVEKGGKIMRPKTSIGENGFFSLLVDTENNTIGLHSLA